MGAEVIAACALLAACARPTDVVVICHNANCAGAPTTEDDTLAQLAASLALTGDDGGPLSDGIEIDLSWSAVDGRCVFAHDLDAAELPDAREAVGLIVDHIASGAQLVRRGDTYHVMIELKGSVDDDLDAHAACALEAAAAMREAASTGRRIAFILESFEPDLLAAVAVRGPAADTLLAATFYLPFGAHTLADFDASALDVVDVHPRLTSPADLGTYAALGVALSLWADRVTPAVLAAFERMQPAYIGTNQVALVSAWLDGG